MPDQKAIRVVVIPITGVPESLLSDRGTNLLSHLMTLLGVKKLDTTSYLKTALRKRAAECWDRYVVWAYRNVPHESTGPTEAPHSR